MTATRTAGRGLEQRHREQHVEEHFVIERPAAAQQGLEQTAFILEGDECQGLQHLREFRRMAMPDHAGHHQRGDEPVQGNDPHEAAPDEPWRRPGLGEIPVARHGHDESADQEKYLDPMAAERLGQLDERGVDRGVDRGFPGHAQQ